MIHAVIDTNVLVSALLTSKSDTATVQVLGTLGVRPQLYRLALFLKMEHLGPDPKCTAILSISPRLRL